MRGLFFHFYSGGCREGISAKVRDALFRGVSYNFDFYPWLTAVRNEWTKEVKFESGQLKIFLGALRAFDKLPPLRITVLVIGSSSHPVRSGYSYHGLANFLTLSGFSGLFHLFDPLENHLSCKIGNFDMQYYAMEYRCGSAYFMEGKHPTVILDDVYSGGDKLLSDIDPTFSIVEQHPNSRVCMKHSPDAKIYKVPGVPYHIAKQFAYGGREDRIYYRVPTANVSLLSQWVGNMQCSQCWYYAALISRIGSPQEDLRPYWKIMYSMVGHHCTPLPGIRNIMLLSALRHEISRGNTKADSISNVLDNLPRSFEASAQSLNRLFVFGESVDESFIAKENHYAPNYDMEMNIRDRVSNLQLLDIISEQNVAFALYPSERYDNAKCEKLLALYSQVDVQGKCIMNLYLYHTALFCPLDDVVLVEDIREGNLSAFDIVYQVGAIAIMIRKGREAGRRILFDRGRSGDGYDDF